MTDDIKVEETPAPSTPTTAPATPASAPAEQPASGPSDVDFDRIKGGDDEYLANLNEEIRQGTRTLDDTGQPTSTQKQEETAAPSAQDDDPVVDTIVYKGQKIEVRKSQMRDLLQKGRHLEVTLAQYAPIRRALEANPDLLEALKNGSVDTWAATRAQAAKQSAVAPADLPQVDGYDPQDVATVSQIVDQRLQKVLQRQRLEDDVRAIHRDLARSHQDYGEIRAAMDRAVQNLELRLPAEQFRDFVQKHNDPNAINPRTGRSYYLDFWDVVKERVRSTRQSPAAPPRATAQSPVPVGQAAHAARPQASSRIAPGAANRTSTARPSAGDPWAISQDEFDRVIGAVLQGG